MAEFCRFVDPKGDVEIQENGAQKRTRTSTPLRAPAPEAGASTNSAIWARVASRDVAWRRVGAGRYRGAGEVSTPRFKWWGTARAISAVERGWGKRVIRASLKSRSARGKHRQVPDSASESRIVRLPCSRYCHGHCPDEQRLLLGFARGHSHCSQDFGARDGGRSGLRNRATCVSL